MTAPFPAGRWQDLRGRIRPLAVPLAVAAAFTWYVASNDRADVPVYLGVCAAVLATVYLVSILFRAASDRTAIIITVVAVQVVLLLLRHVLKLDPDIGDSRWVVEFASTNTVFPRWLGISYLTAGSYALGKTLTLTAWAFAWLFPTPEVFIRSLLGVVILLQSVHLLLHTQHLRVITFIVLSPFALLFLSGHIEIYMVVSLYMVQCFETLRRSNPRPVLEGLLIGGLGVLYYGAWHICLGLLLIAFLRNRSQFMPLFGSFTLTLLIGIDVLWPGDLLHFATTLNANTITGLRLLVLPYHLHAGRGMFWKESFLFTEQHLEIVGRILFFGLAPLLIVLASGVSAARLKQGLSDARRLWRPQVGWIVMVFLSLAFILLMIPRLGVERDIDLYMIPCVAIIYVAASFAELQSAQESLRIAVRHYALYSVLVFGLLLL